MSSILLSIQDEFITNWSTQSDHQNNAQGELINQSADKANEEPKIVQDGVNLFYGSIVKRKLSHKGDLMINLKKKISDTKQSERKVLKNHYIKNIENASNGNYTYVTLHRKVVFNEALKQPHEIIYESCQTKTSPYKIKIYCCSDGNNALLTSRITSIANFLKNLFKRFNRTAEIFQFDKFLPSFKDVEDLYKALQEKGFITENNGVFIINEKYKAWLDENMQKPSKILEAATLIKGTVEETTHSIYLVESKDEEIFKSANRLRLLATQTQHPSIQTFCGIERTDNDDEMLLKGRINELQHSYQERYGDQVAGEAWEEKIREDAISTLKLDMLSHPVHKKFKTCKEVTRNSIFILYNYARLVKINDHFMEKVEQSVYPPLCKIEDVDFSLLTEENEWNLLLRYIINFPNFLNDTYLTCAEKMGSTKININQIYQFLLSLSRDTSAYYHHTKVLMDARGHLFPLMHARLHLLNAIRRTMDECFQLMDIHPPSQM